MKARVFVSSVVDGFEVFRQAAREGIIAAGGEPVLVNEDFPSLTMSSRNACLDAVDSSDILLSIIGARGGWTTPSGKLVVEEEYERAVARKRPVLIFLQNTPRDDSASALARRLSDYVDGAHRSTFTTADDLRAEIERALAPLLVAHPRSNTVASPGRDRLAKPYIVQGTTMLRFMLTPERDEEVVDPVRLSSEGFRRRLLELGHSETVRLFSYERPKTATMVEDDLVIVQTEADGRHGEGEHVRVQVTESGELVIDANVTGRVARGDRFMGLGSNVVATEDIENVLRLCFAFASAMYDEVDPYKRHQRFQLQVGLSGLDYRSIERNPQPRSSFTMSMRDQGVIKAYADPRWVARGDLRNPADEIERAVVLLVRRAGA